MEGAEPPAMTGASPHGATPLPTDDVGRAPDAEPLAPAAAAPAAAQPAVVASPRAEPAAARGAEASIEDVRRVVAETIKRTSLSAASKSRRRRPRKKSKRTPSPRWRRRRPSSRRRGRSSRRRGAGRPLRLAARARPERHCAATLRRYAGAGRRDARRRAPKRSSPRRPRGRTARPRSPPPKGRPPRQPRRRRRQRGSAAEKPAASPPHRGDDRFNVIGRYESEGTSYVMFADGSIDARSTLGAFHFSSMAELKAFMESQTRSELVGRFALALAPQDAAKAPSTQASAKAYCRATSSRRSKRPGAPPWPAPILVLHRIGPPPVIRRAQALASISTAPNR